MHRLLQGHYVHLCNCRRVLFGVLIRILALKETKRGKERLQGDHRLFC